MANVREIEGIGDKSAEMLEAAGIKTEANLLEKGATEKGRAEIAEATGLSAVQIYKWVKMADMNRVNGIGSQTSEVLLACGVDSVKELAQRNAENLHAKMVEVNEEKNLSNRLPSVDQVAKYIEEANSLPRIIIT
jgi:predicted flap endonuclease-1-like 5' DNA nuclease